jgi:hypothetical protein
MGRWKEECGDWCCFSLVAIRSRCWMGEVGQLASQGTRRARWRRVKLVEDDERRGVFAVIKINDEREAKKYYKIIVRLSSSNHKRIYVLDGRGWMSQTVGGRWHKLWEVSLM